MGQKIWPYDKLQLSSNAGASLKSDFWINQVVREGKKVRCEGIK